MRDSFKLGLSNVHSIEVLQIKSVDIKTENVDFMIKCRKQSHFQFVEIKTLHS